MVLKRNYDSYMVASCSHGSYKCYAMDIMYVFLFISERIKAMEEQIASLAGLVHHALSIGPGDKDAVRSVTSTDINNYYINYSYIYYVCCW